MSQPQKFRVRTVEFAKQEKKEKSRFRDGEKEYRGRSMTEKEEGKRKKNGIIIVLDRRVSDDT